MSNTLLREADPSQDKALPWPVVIWPHKHADIDVELQAQGRHGREGSPDPLLDIPGLVREPFEDELRHMRLEPLTAFFGKGAPFFVTGISRRKCGHRFGLGMGLLQPFCGEGDTRVIPSGLACVRSALAMSYEPHILHRLSFFDDSSWVEECWHGTVRNTGMFNPAEAKYANGR